MDKYSFAKCPLCQLGNVVVIEKAKISYNLNGNILETYPTGAFDHQFRIPIQYCPICGRRVGEVNEYTFRRF